MNVPLTVTNVLTACWATWLLRYLLEGELPPRDDLVSSVRMWNVLHSEEKIDLILS